MPPHKPKMNQSACLGWCFLATMAIMAILVFVTYALGQDHAFPFKTWQQINQGTAGWPLDGVPEARFCPGVEGLISKAQYKSGAESIWVIYTNGKVFSAAYFPPGQEKPVSIVVGRIEDGKVIVESNVPYDPEKHRPCDRFQQKSASGGPDGC